MFFSNLSFPVRNISTNNSACYVFLEYQLKFIKIVTYFNNFMRNRIKISKSGCNSNKNDGKMITVARIGQQIHPIVTEFIDN